MLPGWYASRPWLVWIVSRTAAALPFALIAALVLLALASAHAADVVQKPASAIEHPATDGTQWTVIAPLFDGTAGSTSFLRFANGNTFAATITYLVVGSPSGRIYGTASYTIPSGASPQYTFAEVTAKAGFTGYTSGDIGLSLYVRGSAQLMGFQHVIFNPASSFFENMSVCTWDPGFTYSAINQALVNVHTTKMPAYPAIVTLHHYGATAAVYHADIYEARTGAYKGGFNFNMAANETFVVDWSWYEQSAKWAPTATEQHANIIFARVDGPYQAIAGQVIYNNALGSFVNMSQPCPINH